MADASDVAALGRRPKHDDWSVPITAVRQI